MTLILHLLQCQTNRYRDWVYQLSYRLTPYHLTFIPMLLKPRKILMFFCPLLLYLIVTIHSIPVSSTIIIVSSVLSRLVSWNLNESATCCMGIELSDFDIISTGITSSCSRPTLFLMPCHCWERKWILAKFTLNRSFFTTFHMLW